MLKCKSCGGDRFTLTMHMDGKEFYINVYRCDGCGETLQVERKRTKEDADFWKFKEGQ